MSGNAHPSLIPLPARASSRTPTARCSWTATAVVLIKDLPLKGSSQSLKGGTKSKPIRLVEGDHEISCKMDGISIGLKACFVKKA